MPPLPFAKPKTRFWSTLRTTFRSRAFVVLRAIGFAFVVPTTMLSGLSRYAGTYYVFHGDQALMSKYYFYGSIGYLGCGLLGVLAASHLARRRGKRAALLFTLATGLVAYARAGGCNTPDAGWLIVANTALTGFSSTGLWVVLPSMCVDVVDDDEVGSGQRREGAFTSWYSWVIKLGMAVSFWASDALLEVVGYRQSLGARRRRRPSGGSAFFAAIPVGALLVAPTPWRSIR